MKAPTNTSKMAMKDFFDMLADQMLTGRSIENQEARGQQELVESSVLPTELRNNAMEALLQAGVIFLGPVEGDKLFQYVELPEGWKLDATKHSMHSNLLDEKGRVRAGIFYKAAHYDRRASLHTVPRYSVAVDYDHKPKDEFVVNVLDCDKVIFSTEPVKMDRQSVDLYKAEQAVIAQARAWVTERFPQWERHDAYWGDE